MNLDQIKINARLRTSWEAIDLGFIMARTWWWPLLLSWAIPSLLFFSLTGIIFYDNPFIAVTLTWWLKPLWDRYPLFIASRAVFNEKISVAAALKHSFSLLKTDLPAWLLWRRFSFSRSFDMPLTVLEGTKGQPRQHRLILLHQVSGGAASWLTLICIHLEMIILMGLYALALLLIPQNIDYRWQDALTNPSLTAQWLECILIYTAMLLIAPFYTAAGFALYINRRIELEGWDIEVWFRHLAQRLNSSSHKQYRQNQQQKTKNKHQGATTLQTSDMMKNNVQILGFVVLFSSLLFALPSTVTANDSIHVTEAGFDEAPTSSQIPASSTESEQQLAAKALISEVLNGRDFTYKEMKRGFRLKKDDSETENEYPQWLIKLVELLETLTPDADLDEKTPPESLIARLVELVLWVCVFFLIAYFLFHYRKAIKALFGKSGSSTATQASRPDVMFGLDIRKESIPEDICEQVLTYWQQMKYRQALNLLYRGTLSRLVHDYEFQFSDGATENECAEQVRTDATQTISLYVSELTQVWLKLAYGHQLPAEATVESLCSQWQIIFSNNSQVTPPSEPGSTQHSKSENL